MSKLFLRFEMTVLTQTVIHLLSKHRHAHCHHVHHPARALLIIYILLLVVSKLVTAKSITDGARSKWVDVTELHYNESVSCQFFPLYELLAKRDKKPTGMLSRLKNSARDNIRSKLP